jgi:hypothetical protein
MTERYTGWKWPEQDAEERDVEMQAHLERYREQRVEARYEWPSSFAC